MSHAVTASPFRPISLSSTDTKKLQVLAKTILDTNFDQYQHFSGVDLDKWKLVKLHDQMRVYSSQARHNQSQRDRVDGDSDLDATLIVGSTPGTFDDVMHGVLGPTSGNEFSAAAVLSSIREPTPTKPFQSVAVKWMKLDLRRRSMGLAKDRDFVYVEATGVEKLPSGECLGYHLMHSVDVTGAHEFPAKARAKLSVCSFFRQGNDKKVLVYTMAMLDPINDRVRRVFVPRFVTAILSMFTCAPSGKKMQKLVRTLSKSYRDVENNNLLHSNLHCTTCTKRVWRLGKFARFNTSCMLCCEHVCSSCKIEKKVKLQTPDQKDTTKKVVFCFSCLTDVMVANDPAFFFVEDLDDAGMTRSAHNSVWALRTPTWSISRKKKETFDFASTR